MLPRNGNGKLDAVFLGAGLVVVVTLVTLPFVGRFFAAALAGGVILAGGMLRWHLRRHP